MDDVLWSAGKIMLVSLWILLWDPKVFIFEHSRFTLTFALLHFGQMIICGSFLHPGGVGLFMFVCCLGLFLV